MGAAKITQWQMDRIRTRIRKLSDPVIKKLLDEIEKAIKEVPVPEYWTAEDAWMRLTTGIVQLPAKAFKQKVTRNIVRATCVRQSRYVGNRHIPAKFSESHDEKLPAMLIDVMGASGLDKKNFALAKKRANAIKKIRTNSPQAKKIEQIRADEETLLDAIALEGANYAQEALVRFERALSKHS